MEKYLNYTKLSNDQQQVSEVKNWVNTTLFAYLSKNMENQTEIEHILDYLLSDKSPRRLRKMSYEQAKKGSEKWTASLIKKGGNIVETEEDVEVILKSKPDSETQFKYVKLLSKEAYQREGNLMSHCVASYFGREDVEIYSLRDSSNNPHCTIEISKTGNRINQIKGKGNGSIHPKYIKFVLKILKYHKLDVNDSEMNNLGYIYFTEEEIKVLSPILNDSSVKYTIFNNKTYFFKESLR